MNIFDYWVWQNRIPSKQIIELNKKIDGLTSEDQDNKADTTKIADVKILSLDLLEENLKPYLVNLYSVNEYNFGYNLYPYFYNKCNYTVYNDFEKGEYDWHIDQSGNNFHDIKLTAILNISEKAYEGGEFKIFQGTEQTIDKFSKPGDIIVFKSYINHKVTPVTKGTRKTLTIFLKGPKLT